jgi:hypothetical protein
MTVRSTTLAQSIYPVLQVAENQQYAVTSMFFCNTTDEESILQVYIVSGDPTSPGGSPSNTNKIIHNLTISPGDTFTFDTEKIILDSGDSIQANQGLTGGISCTISYVRVA